MEQTPNYGLNKPGQDEFYDVDDFNENADILDEKLKEVEDKADKHLPDGGTTGQALKKKSDADQDADWEDDIGDAPMDGKTYGRKNGEWVETGGGGGALAIAITSQPTKTHYTVGDTLDLTGLVVTATYEGGTTVDVTSACTFSPAEGSILDLDDNKVVVTFGSLIANINITVSDMHCYGVSWLGTADSKMTRTDDAADFADPVPYVAGMQASECSSPFDNLMPWSGMEIVDDAEAGKLVKIPKYWFKWTRTGDTMKLQISDRAQDGFFVSPAHADRGDGKGERDFVYVGRYHSASDYKSKSGVTPKNNITRSQARSNISNLGSTIWQIDYAMWWTVNMLFLVEFADWDSQKVIGYGCGPNTSSLQNTGASDGIPYHTGTVQSSKTTYGVGIQYRYIEDWWANCYDWLDGIYFNNTTIYGIKNPANFSDSSGGTNIGTRQTNDGYTKNWTNPSADGFEYMLYPNDVVSSHSYVCDYCVRGSSYVVLRFGGDCYSQVDVHGAFYLDDSSASGSYWYVGCRLQKLP